MRIQGCASLAIFFQLIQGYASLDILSQPILVYPYLRNLYWDIQGYPDLPRVSLFQMMSLPSRQRRSLQLRRQGSLSLTQVAVEPCLRQVVVTRLLVLSQLLRMSPHPTRLPMLTFATKKLPDSPDS